tara:strand:+ start:69 stop:638 length:570 start_codon:yes stop_codon:yes gene_type:complete
MDITLQRELDDINSLLNVSSDEKLRLEKQIQNYTNNQLSKLNNTKEQEIYTKINNILKQMCNQIANEFNIDINLINTIYNNHKVKLKNDFHENSHDETSHESDNNQSDSDSDSDSEQHHTKTNSINTTQNSTNNIQITQNIPICIEVNKPTKPIKCPANKGSNGELCGRMTIKTTNFTYCGYHKKYFKP